MTTFIALVLVMVFVHVAATTYVRHEKSQSVRDLWDSPFRYNYFRPEPESPAHEKRRSTREDRTSSSCGA